MRPGTQKASLSEASCGKRRRRRKEEFWKIKN